MRWKRVGQYFAKHCPDCTRAKERERKGQKPKALVPADRQRGDATTDCRKCDGPRTWDNHTPKTGRHAGKVQWSRRCAACDAKKSKGWRAKNPERVKENFSSWSGNNQDKCREREARRRARLAEVPDDGWSFKLLTKMKNTGEHTCFICEKATADTVEHLMPVSLGGGNVWANLGLACQSCNSAKGNRTYPGSPGWDEFLRERRES